LKSQKIYLLDLIETFKISAILSRILFLYFVLLLILIGSFLTNIVLLQKSHNNIYGDHITAKNYTYCIASHYITLHHIALHCITLHYIALHYTTLHYITLHYIALHYITLHPLLVHHLIHIFVLCKFVTNTNEKVKKYNIKAYLVLCQVFKGEQKLYSINMETSKFYLISDFLTKHFI